MARGRLVEAQVSTAATRGKLVDAVISSGPRRGKLVDAVVQTAIGRGQLVDATVATAAARGKLVDAVVKTAPARGRLVDAIIAPPPTIIGYFGRDDVWVPVKGYLGVAGVWVPVKRWTGTPIPPPDPPPTTRNPVSYPSLAAAREALGAPTDANYVTWDPAWTSQGLRLQEVFTSKLAANDILVLPERVAPYEIDSSNGFMASGVGWITGQLPNDTPQTRIQIVSNPRCWFEMARGRRGILGLGPGAVVQPSASSFSRPAQPITQDTGGTMSAYNAGGGFLQNLVGAQDALMRFDHANAWCGNFILKGRDFGGVAYSGMFAPNVVNFVGDAASRGHAGVPNGETGTIASNNVNVRYENVDIITTDSTGARVVVSPMMLNRNTGGTFKNVTLGRPRAGMLTFWRCTGSYTMQQVKVAGNDVSMNLEEGGPGFVLNWDGGSVSTVGSYHIVGEASPGSKVLTFNNLEVSGGIPDAQDGLALHFYSYTGTAVQRRSNVSRNNGPLYFYGSAFIA